MQLITSLMMFSVLLPVKMWFAPNQPLLVDVKSDGDVTLVLTDFTGKGIDPAMPADITGGKQVDLKTYFPVMTTPGSYVLYAVPKGKSPDQFIGTPLVLTVRQDLRPASPPGPLVTRIEPLRYAVLSTDKGDMTMVFYFDAAPNTVNNFLTLAEQGYYDGLTFHRIVPGFVLQAGDPRGDGTGGPGYQIDAEFNDHKHDPGVLSMARSGDPNEASGVMPRSEFANSAGSQFFVCLDYNQTRHLDGRYTAFGKVVQGMDVVQALAQTPLADATAGRPQQAPVIQKIQVKPVTAKNNPYAAIMYNAKSATTQP